MTSGWVFLESVMSLTAWTRFAIVTKKKKKKKKCWLEFRIPKRWPNDLLTDWSVGDIECCSWYNQQNQCWPWVQNLNHLWKNNARLRPIQLSRMCTFDGSDRNDIAERKTPGHHRGVIGQTWSTGHQSDWENKQEMKRDANCLFTDQRWHEAISFDSKCMDIQLISCWSPPICIATQCAYFFVLSVCGKVSVLALRVLATEACGKKLASSMSLLQCLHVLHWWIPH